MELSSAKIKKVLIFSQKKSYLYFGKWNFLKNLLTFQEETSQAQIIQELALKKFLRLLYYFLALLILLLTFLLKKFLYFF